MHVCIAESTNVASYTREYSIALILLTVPTNPTAWAPQTV